VINCPVYPPFYQCVSHTGRPIEEASLGGDQRIDFDVLETAFERAAQHGPRPVYLLCSPHNPTGTVHTADELTAVAAVAARHGVRVVSDEIHAPIVLPGAVFVSYLSVPGSENAFALMSASKAWNLAGIKAAVALAGPAAADDLGRIPAWIGAGASHVGVIAHTAALRDGTAWLDAVLQGLDANRRLLKHLLAEQLPRVRYQPGEGTYLAWLDCRDLGLGDDPAAVLLEHGKVALNSGPTFGTGGAGYARLNLATSPELITEAVRRMAAATAIATST
jgi:cystathionine beta-lyase